MMRMVDEMADAIRPLPRVVYGRGTMTGEQFLDMIGYPATPLRDVLRDALLEHLIGPGGRCACGSFVADRDPRRTADHIALVALGVTR